MHRNPWSSAQALPLALALAALPIPVPAGPPPDGSMSLLVLYLEAPAGPAREVRLFLGGAVLTGERDSLPLGMGARTLAAGKGPGSQVLLCEQAIPPGRYASLRLRFDSISAYAQAAPIRPAPPPGGLAVPLDLQTAAGRAAPLFLFWDPALDSLDSAGYRPSIRARPEARVPPASLAIVANAGSHYLTCIDRFRRRVVDVLPSGRRPMDMVYASGRREFYVANSASDDITVLDLHAGRPARTLSLRGGDEPRRLALSEDQRRLYVLNGGSNSVSVLNLASHQEEGRVQLESEPAALAVDDGNGAVYVTSRESDRLYAIDPGNLSATSLLRFGANLDELALNRKERRLYVVKPAQRQLSVLDLARNAVTGHIQLCSPASGLAFHPVTRALFASLRDCAIVAVLKPEDNLELGSIRLPHAPGRIGLDPEAKSLLVTFPGEGRLAFYNANSWKQQALLEVGKQPSAVAFAP